MADVPQAQTTANAQSAAHSQGKDKDAQPKKPEKPKTVLILESESLKLRNEKPAEH